jgi:ATP-dependent DNA ligase
MLWDLVKPADGMIQFSEHVDGGGAAFFQGVEKLGCESACKIDPISRGIGVQF